MYIRGEKMKTIQLLAAVAIALAPAYVMAEPTDTEIAATQDSQTMTPAMRASKAQNASQFPTPDHEEAYNNLSEKNQKAYDGLEGHEQDQVVESYKSGDDHQKTMSD